VNNGFRSGLRKLNGQIDQHKFAMGCKSQFCCRAEDIMKGQFIIRSQAFATFSTTEKTLAGCMLYRPALDCFAQ